MDNTDIIQGSDFVHARDPSRLFFTPELLQIVFLQTDFRTILTCQRVCRFWKEFVLASRKLQETVFMRPIPWNTEHGQRRHKPKLNPLIPCQPYAIKNYQPLPGLEFTKPTDAWQREEASWRRMLVTQPPWKYIRIMEAEPRGPNRNSKMQLRATCLKLDLKHREDDSKSGHDGQSHAQNHYSLGQFHSDLDKIHAQHLLGGVLQTSRNKRPTWRGNEVDYLQRCAKAESDLLSPEVKKQQIDLNFWCEGVECKGGWDTKRMVRGKRREGEEDGDGDGQGGKVLNTPADETSELERWLQQATGKTVYSYLAKFDCQH
ncbi:F-box protein [Aspergillus stella-maris]|uniref:F-box protein n=1 Tax=Aspergillus stella-maris TaxID=1810926 RepID=UPI003CCE4228